MKANFSENFFFHLINSNSNLTQTQIFTLKFATNLTVTQTSNQTPVLNL